jgi:diguanylate cyclase (GGDEF)-like protein
LGLKIRDTQRFSTSLLDIQGDLDTSPGFRFPTIAPERERDTEPGAQPAAPQVKDRAALVMLTGINAGQVFTLEEERENTLGRGSDSTCFVDDSGVSRLHARIYRDVEGGRWLFEDRGSTNGSFVGGKAVKAPTEVKSGDRIQLGPNVVLRFAILDATEADLQRKLFDSSTRDALTHLYNRRYFAERLVAEVAYARRHQTPLALIMIDVDHFKAVNDTYGHLAGDAVLCAVADEILRVVRTEDVVARYGGEEMIVLARASGRDAGARLAERIRASMAELRVNGTGAPATIRLTVSLGVAVLDELDLGTEESALIGLADARLYRAKQAGRNRVVTEDS